MVDSVSISVSALRANAIKAGVAANNIAGASAVGPATPNDDGPSAYTPQDVVMVSDGLGGVTATVQNRDPATVPAYDPNSPYADDTGMVAVPNVDLASEMVDLTLAKTAYAASLKALQMVQEMDDALFKAVDKKV